MNIITMLTLSIMFAELGSFFFPLPLITRNSLRPTGSLQLAGGQSYGGS